MLSARDGQQIYFIKLNRDAPFSEFVKICRERQHLVLGTSSINGVRLNVPESTVVRKGDSLITIGTSRILIPWPLQGSICDHWLGSLYRNKAAAIPGRKRHLLPRYFKKIYMTFHKLSSRFTLRLVPYRIPFLRSAVFDTYERSGESVFWQNNTW